MRATVKEQNFKKATVTEHQTTPCNKRIKIKKAPQ